jgi:chromosome segregation ATPase
LCKAIEKEVTTAQKVGDQFRKKLSTLQAKLKTLRERQIELTTRVKEKPTTAAKNQLTKVNETLKVVNTQARKLRSELADAMQTSKAATGKKKHFLAQQKALTAFEKVFAKVSVPKKRHRRTKKKVAAITD